MPALLRHQNENVEHIKTNIFNYSKSKNNILFFSVLKFFLY